MAENTTDTSQKRLVEFENKLRDVFRDVLQHHHADLRVKFDSILGKAEEWCSSQKQEDFDQLEAFLEDLRPDKAILVRAWSMCRLAGIPRSRRQYFRVQLASRLHQYRLKHFQVYPMIWTCAVQVASAFSHMLNLHNLSENVVSSSMVRSHQLPLTNSSVCICCSDG